MPMYGWKPEFQIPTRKKPVWGTPPDISPHKSLKKEQLTKTKIPPQSRDPTEDELQILYEREIYRLFNLHASNEELLKQYKQFANEKVCPGMIRAWLMNSYQGEADRLGMPDGEGTASMANGYVCYKGRFKQGLLHGRGRLQWGKVCSYEGDFYCNRLHGNGTYNWAGIAKYTGEIYDGIPHGIGIMEQRQGLKYEGTLEYNKREGKGKMTFGDTAVYEGNWKNDLQDGEGNLLFKTGSSYHGTWLEGKRHGEGSTQVQRIIPSKERNRKVSAYSHFLALKGKPDSIYAHTYSGDWMGGLPHGRGKSEWSWDDKKKDISVLVNSYVGTYENGMRHGPGSFLYASGARFQGHWRKNMKVGLGFLVYETGMLHFGIFSHDRYDPISNPRQDIKEPLESALQLATEDLQTSKCGVWRAIMRHRNIIQDIFALYCSIVKETPKLIVPPLLEKDKNPKDSKAKENDKSPAKDTKSQKSKSPPKSTMQDSKQSEESPKKSKKSPKNKESKDEMSKSQPNESSKEEKTLLKMGEVVKIAQPDRPDSPRAIQGRSRGMSNEQFWRLLHDGHMLYPGLGYGMVDRMLPQNDLSWDSFSDIHSYTRQLILREIISVFVQIGLTRYQQEDISSEEKVERLLASHLQLLKFVDNDSLFAKAELLRVQDVFHANRLALDKLFCELLLESETPDYTIKLMSLVQFGKRRKAELDVPNGALLASLALEVYSVDMIPNDSSKLLDQDINYKEYEVILLLFATMGKDLPKIPHDEIFGLNLKDKLNTTSPIGNKSPRLQGKLQVKFAPTKEGNEKDENSLPNSGKSPTLPKPPTSPKSPKSPKVAKDVVSKPQGKVHDEKLVGLDAKEAEAKAKEARMRAKEEYEGAIANLLNNFIVDEVAVYKAPNVVKGDSKRMKGKPQNLSPKATKK